MKYLRHNSKRQRHHDAPQPGGNALSRERLYEEVSEPAEPESRPAPGEATVVDLPALERDA